MPTAQTKRAWATVQDWDMYQDTIINLYDGQNTSLKEIVQIMKDRHQFYATYVHIFKKKTSK
jgi:hypothetical protein